MAVGLEGCADGCGEEVEAAVIGGGGDELLRGRERSGDVL